MSPTAAVLADRRPDEQSNLDEPCRRRHHRKRGKTSSSVTSPTTTTRICGRRNERQVPPARDDNSRPERRPHAGVRPKAAKREERRPDHYRAARDNARRLRGPERLDHRAWRTDPSLRRDYRGLPSSTSSDRARSPCTASTRPTACACSLTSVRTLSPPSSARPRLLAGGADAVRPRPLPGRRRRAHRDRRGVDIVPRPRAGTTPSSSAWCWRRRLGGTGNDRVEARRWARCRRVRRCSRQHGRWPAAHTTTED